MKYILDQLRVTYKHDYTEGKLFLPDEKKAFFDVLEDRYRDLSKESKVYGKTCIPFGLYRMVVTYSPKFVMDMVLLLDVPYFEGIRCHWGISAEKSEGCPLYGLRVGPNRLQNVGATKKLVALVREQEAKGNEVWLRIR